jgi:peptidoglycan/xylan/chitin deacetylase (PgdA/CDA1 family)
VTQTTPPTSAPIDLAGFWGSFQGAVSITLDDGDKTQRDVSTVCLDEFGFKGSYYLMGCCDDRHLESWVPHAEHGHEMGNHSYHHRCSGTHSGRLAGQLEHVSLNQLEDEILQTQDKLQRIFPHQKSWTYCYPCYNLMVGRGAQKQTYSNLIAKHFLAGRAGGETGLANHPNGVDLSVVAGTAVENFTPWEMIGLIEELAIEQHKWLVLVFHTIDGDCLPVSRKYFMQLLRYLDRRRSEIWTAPFVDVAQKIAQWQNMNLPGGSGVNYV